MRGAYASAMVDVLDILPGDTDGPEAERRIEPFWRLGRVRPDEDLVGALLAHMRDHPGNNGRSDAALAKGRQSEQILDYTQSVGADHARPIGTIHTVLARQEELISRRFLAIAGDHPPRDLHRHSPAMGRFPFGMVMPDERVEALPVGLGGYRAEVKVTRMRPQWALQHELDGGRQFPVIVQRQPCHERRGGQWIHTEEPMATMPEGLVRPLQYLGDVCRAARPYLT